MINIYTSDYSMCIINFIKISLHECLIMVGNYPKQTLLLVEKAFLNIITSCLVLLKFIKCECIH